MIKTEKEIRQWRRQWENEDGVMLRKIIYRDDSEDFCFEFGDQQKIIKNQVHTELIADCVEMLKQSDGTLNRMANEIVEDLNAHPKHREPPVGEIGELVWEGVERLLYAHEDQLIFNFMGEALGSALVPAFSYTLKDREKVKLALHSVKKIQYTAGILEREAIEVLKLKKSEVPE